jgi:hypothetical protein
MHLEMTNKICALCKRLVAANGHPDPTRLCEECRSLIQTILPRTGSNSFIGVEQARTFAQTQRTREGAAQPALAASASYEEDLGDVEIISRSGRFELASFDPVADFDEVQTDHISRIETEYLDEFEASDEQAYMSAEALLDPIDEAMAQAVEPAAQEPQFFMRSVQEEDFHNEDVMFEDAPSREPGQLDLPRDEEPERIVSLPHMAETNTQADFKEAASMNMEAAKRAEAIPDTEETSYQEAVDPWDDPLPAWDHSRNEYPLYIGIPERKRRSRLKKLLVPAVVLASLVVAYLLLQSRNNAPQNQPAVESSAVETSVEPSAEGNLGSSLPVATPQPLDSTKPASDDA